MHKLLTSWRTVRILTLGLLAVSGQAQASQSFCLAIPGNGARAFSHIGAISRIFETIGTEYDLKGIAGESSGSVMSFFADTIWSSPLVKRCGNRDCSQRERGQRASLLFKSLMGYLANLEQSPELTAATGLVPTLKALTSFEGDFTRKPGDAARLLAIVHTLYQDRHYAALLNWAWLTRIEEAASRGPRFLQSAFDQMKLAADLPHVTEFTDNSAVFRDGILNMDYLIKLLGRIANFYSGSYDRGATLGLRRFLDACSERTSGQDWEAANRVPSGPISGQPATCGSLFAAALAGYQARHSSQPAQIEGRLAETVGSSIPALIATSVIDDPRGIEAYSKGLARYRQSFRQVPQESFDFDGNYLHIGYFGSGSDLEKVESSIHARHSDARAKAFRSLGQASWYDALRFSSSEPGGSTDRRLGNGWYSAGGWPDPSPVHVLESLDSCDTVVLIARPTEIGGFYRNTFAIYHWGDPERPESIAYQHFSVKNQESSENLARSDADLVWCADWDRNPNASPTELFAIGYHPHAYLPPRRNSSRLKQAGWGLNFNTPGLGPSCMTSIRPAHGTEHR